MAVGTREQPFRDGAQARADFYQLLAGLGANAADDAFDHPSVVQEVLAEPFTGFVAIQAVVF